MPLKETRIGFLLEGEAVKRKEFEDPFGSTAANKKCDNTLRSFVVKKQFQVTMVRCEKLIHDKL